MRFGCRLIAGLSLLSILSAGEVETSRIDTVIRELQELTTARSAAWTKADARRWCLRFAGGAQVHGRKAGSRADGRTRNDLIWSAADVAGTWRGAGLREPIPDLWHLLESDAGGLQRTEAGGLRGTLRLQVQRGDWKHNLEVYTTNFQGVAKSQSIPVMDWALGIPQQQPGWQSWQVEADPLPGGISLTGRLARALSGHDITFSCVLQPTTGVLTSSVQVPGFNRAAHRVAAGELRLADGRLTGTLDLVFNRDPWVPKDLPPAGCLRQSYRINLPVAGDRVAGTVTGEGDLGTGPCLLEASAMQALVGRYRSDGIDGACDGVLYGGVAPLNDPGSVVMTADTLEHRYRQLAALVEELQGDVGLWRKVPFQRLLGQDSADGIRCLSVWAENNLAAVRAGHRPHLGIDRALDPAFGPFYADAEDLPQQDGSYLLPEAVDAGTAGQRWVAIPTFTAWGPLLDDGKPLTWDDGACPVLPEIVPGARLPGLVDGSWMTRRNGRIATVDEAVAKALDQAQVGNSVWYAEAVLRSTTDRDTWLAIMVHEDGALYHDGVLVWASGWNHGGRETAVVPIHLHAGDNDLLIRVGSLQGRGRYAHGKGGPGSLALHCCLAGSPRRALAEPAVPSCVPVDESPAELPVLAWDLAMDSNIIWRRSTTSRHAPVPVDDGVLVVDDALCCLAAADGNERWSVAAPAAGSWLAPVVDAAAIIYVAHGSGTVVALGSDGAERWRVQVEPAATAGSLHLAGDLLLWYRPGTGGRVVALARQDGAQRWVTDVPGAVAQHACLVPPEADRALALVTNGGSVIAVADGSPIAIGMVPGPPCPLAGVARGSRVILRGGEVALDLVRVGDGRPGCRLAWEVERYTHYGYPDWPGAGPVWADDGLVYVLRDAPEHSTHGPLPASHLYQIDGGTGHMTGYRKRFIENALNPSDLRCTGRLLAAVDRGGKIFAGEDRGPQVALALSGDPPAILGVNSGLPGGRAPVADGRGGWYLYGGGELCRAALKDDFGRRMMVNQVLRSLLTWDLSSRPDPQPVTAIAPLATWVDPGTVPVQPFWPKASPQRWLADTPQPKGADDRPPPQRFLDGPAAWTGLHAVDPACMNRNTNSSAVDGRAAYVPCFSVDPLRLLGRQPQTEIHLASVLRADGAQVVRVHANCYGTTVWLNGSRLAHGQLIALQPGDYPLVVRFSLGRVMDFMQRISATVTFLPAQDPAQEMAEWKARVRQRQTLLQQLRALDPDGPGSLTASFLLAEIAAAE